jgi:hypothetical protein
MAVTLSEINIYPIKSLCGIALSEAVVEERGLQFDRRWMLVDDQGIFLTQRVFPNMATLKVSLENDGLQITNKTKETLFVPLAPPTNEKLKVTVWSSQVSAEVYDAAINDWFSTQLQINCRLVSMPEDTRRIVNPLYAVRKFQDVVSFADGYPVLLIGENSLANLNEKLKKPLPMNRFRPNLVVKNSEPFAEDNWKQIRIGETVFHLVKPCDRCVMTTVDQEKGEFDGQEPLRALSKFRLKKKSDGQKILFGQNLIAENFGATVKIGDEIEILD